MAPDWNQMAREYVVDHLCRSRRPTLYVVDDEAGPLCFCTGNAAIEALSIQTYRLFRLREQFEGRGFRILAETDPDDEGVAALVIEAIPERFDEAERIVRAVLGEVTRYWVNSLGRAGGKAPPD